MSEKPSYEELEQRVKELEKESIECKRVEKALKKAEQEKAAILDSMTEHVVYHDMEHRVLWANRAAGESVDLAPGQLAGRHCYEIWQQRTKPCLGCPVEKAIETGLLQETETTTPDGRVWFIRGHPIRDANGKITGGVETTLEITEHKRAEEALRESEERYRKLFEEARDGIFLGDAETGVIVDCNYEATNLVGRDKSELIGQHQTILHPPHEGNGRFSETFQRHLGESEGHVLETQIITSTGEIKEVAIKANLLHASGRKLLQAMFRDITEQKQAELALRESEERYRNLSEQSTDAIYITTREGGLLYANQSFLDLFGYTRKEIGAMKAQKMYVNPEDRLTFQQEIEKKESVRDFEVMLRKKDGAEMDCLIAATVRRADDGTILGYQGIIRDITERKRMEEALRESEEKYRTILESIEEGCFEVDLAGNLTFCNDALCAISGFSRAELMGMNNREYTSPETAKKMYTFFNKIYRTGKPAKIMDFEIIRKDGAKMVFEMSASLMRDQAGEPIGFRGVVRDITERKRAEQENQKLQSQLQQAQKMEALGTLAGGIAHNFNNLLTGILGNTALTLLDIGPTHPHYDRLKSIEKLVESGSKLTKQLLGYARKGSYEVKPISLNRVVKETSDTFGATKKEIRVHQELAEDLWGVRADQGQIEQVLWNLYINAADAMPNGGDLSLRTMNATEKDMSCKPYKPKPGAYVLLMVRDNGIGMDNETLDHIFEPFFTTKTLGAGSGLGLASVYGIIKAHRGYIDVDSREGEGTTFEIYLPASKEELMREESKVPEVMLIGTESILLVDDEDMVLDVGREILEALGYTVFVAKSGKEAIAFYEDNKEKIAMIILDIIMPDMGGGETFDRLKELNPDVKVLLSSGYSIDGRATEILQRGCDGFIQKPFSIKGLSGQIREILHKG